MLLGCIEGEYPPDEAPKKAQRATRVEHTSPAIMSDQDAAQHVRESHAETEPCHPGNLPRLRFIPT